MSSIMASAREPPIIISAAEPPPNAANSAAIIFIHGLGDDAAGVENIAHQFQAASKLPHMSWVLPNAQENRDVMSTAWYIPTALSPYASSRPELEDEEDETGMKASKAYIESLIDDLVSQGVSEKRIVLGGFSQGCAMTLLTGLTSSKYAGRLAGLAGLSGYLPLADKIPTLREVNGLPRRIADEVPIFLARGTRDMLVPKRHFRICHEALVGLGLRQERLTVKEYEGMGHVLSGAELRDLCIWLETALPPLDGLEKLSK